MNIADWLPEFKVSAEADRDLMTYFLRTPYVDKVIKQDRWLILGKKGSGKTAIFEYFRSASKVDIASYNVVPLNFKDYPWPVHRLYKEAMEGELTAYQLSWRYLFYTSVLSSLIRNAEEKNEPLSAELKIVKDILKSFFDSPFPSLIEIIKSKIFRVNKLSLPSAAAGELNFSLGEAGLDELSKSDALKSQLRSNVYQLTNFFELALKKSLSGNTKVLLALDQLDENWLSDELEEYSRILVNLINVCRGINTDPILSRNIKICLFLRTDIYDTLKFNDKTKVFQDGAVEVRWDETQLDDMFFQRIQKYKPSDFDLQLDKKTNSLFNVSFVRHGAPPFKHLSRRTFYRPRDVVVFLNKVREHFVERKGEEKLYTSEDIYGAEKLYSANVYGELIDEWSVQKPDFDKLLTVLQQIHYQTFTFQEFATAYEKIFSTNDQMVRYQEELRFLFKNSIVGQKPRAHWEYVCTNNILNIDFAKDFHIHSSLKSRLGIIESRGGGNNEDEG